MEFRDGILIGLILGVLATILFFHLIIDSIHDDWRLKAIDSGSAYYKVEPKTGKTTFTWKHLEKAEK